MAVDNTEDVVNLKGHVTIPFSFGIDGDGNYGYYRADGSLIPFKKGYENTPGTANAADITTGKTAWVNGELITGTRPAPVNSQSGSFTSGILWKGDTYTYKVTFTTPFDKVPTITYTMSNSNTSIPASYVGRSIYNISKESFSMNLSGNCPSGYSNSGIVTIYWTATV